MRGAECVIMAGDPQQLPPTVRSALAYECDLDRTIFDRLQVGCFAASLLSVCPFCEILLKCLKKIRLALLGLGGCLPLSETSSIL